MTRASLSAKNKIRKCLSKIIARRLPDQTRNANKLSMNIDMRSKHRDGCRLFEKLGLVTWAGPELVEDPESLGLVVVLELLEPEGVEFVDPPAKVAEDLAATEDVGALVLIGTGELFVLADAWLVTTIFVVGVAAVVWVLAITTLVDVTG